MANGERAELHTFCEIWWEDQRGKFLIELLPRRCGDYAVKEQPRQCGSLDGVDDADLSPEDSKNCPKESSCREENVEVYIHLVYDPSLAVQTVNRQTDRVGCHDTRRDLRTACVNVTIGRGYVPRSPVHAGIRIFSLVS